MEQKKYVVLEHLLPPYKGQRFWSTNTDDNTHSLTGELWYKEILLTDSEDEAMAESKKVSYENLPTQNELVEHFVKHPEDIMDVYLNMLNQMALQTFKEDGKLE